MLFLMQESRKSLFGLRGFTAWLLVVGLAGEVGEALGQQAGTLRWKVELGAEARSSPAIGPDGTIYVGSYDLDTTRRALYSISPEGATNWTFLPGGAILSSPSIGADGTVYLGSTDRRLYAISPAGTTNWTFLTGGQVLATAATGADGTVYVNAISNYFNKLYAINPNGGLNWIFSMGGVPFSGSSSAQFSSPAIGPDGTIYVGSLDRKLYAISRGGKTNWTFSLVDVTYSSPTIGRDGTIYIGADDGKVYAVDPQGRKKWVFSTGTYVESSAAIGSNGGVYIGSLNGNLYALGSSGGLNWSRAIGGVSCSPAVGQGDIVFAGSVTTPRFIALTSSNSVAWSFPLTNATFSSPAIGADGTIYFGAGRQLLALYGTNNLASTAWPMFRRDGLHQARSIQRGITPPEILADRTAVMTLTVETGRSYRVQASVDLVAWADLSNFVSTNNFTQLNDTAATNFPQRFYRVVTP